MKNWKVMAWLAAALLTLADSAFPLDSRQGAPDELQSISRQAPWLPAGQGPGWGHGGRAPRLRRPGRPSLEEQQEGQTRWRSPPPPHSPDAASARAARKRRPPEGRGGPGEGPGGRGGRVGDPDCRVEKRQVSVRDLGLGFDSDETVVFRYCVGTCRRARRSYDLALRALRLGAGPCCRPSRYRAVSFMDAHATWRTVRGLSAVGCSCVG